MSSSGAGADVSEVFLRRAEEVIEEARRLERQQSTKAGGAISPATATSPAALLEASLLADGGTIAATRRALGDVGCVCGTPVGDPRALRPFLLPAPALLTTSAAEVRAHYPDAPARPAAFPAASTSAGTSSHASALLAAGAGQRRHAAPPVAAAVQVGQKRQRRPSDEKAEGAAAASAPVEPSAVFSDDFEAVDYTGRSFLEPPPALVQQQQQQQQQQSHGRTCVPPRNLKGAFKVSSLSAAAAGPDALGEQQPAGVQELCWAPPRYAHLMFSADLRGVARLWSSESRRCLAAYTAHTQAVKSLAVTSDAALFSSASADGTVAVWDTASGTCAARLTNEGGLPVMQHAHHPSREDALVLAAVDAQVVLYDIRASASRPQREYSGHRGSILSLTLLGAGGGKFLTTAEDRTLRSWDFRLPVQITQIADPTMHAISHVAAHPTSPELLAAQSQDNKVIVFAHEGGGRVRRLRQREFSGHNVAGTRCRLAFSPDGTILSSGDISGALLMWDWATGELKRSFPAHRQMLAAHLWHPLERSRVVTASWDGLIKNWV